MRTLIFSLALAVAAAVPAAAQGGPQEPADSMTYELATHAEVRPPVLRNRQQVAASMAREYPAGYRQQGVAGSVTVRFRVEKNGTVDDSSMSTVGQADPLFAEAAMSVARRMRFTPARVDGKPVRVWVVVPVTFQIIPGTARQYDPQCGSAQWCQPQP